MCISTLSRRSARTRHMKNIHGNKRKLTENTYTTVKDKKLRLQKVNTLGFVEIQSSHSQLFRVLRVHKSSLLETINKHNMPIKFNLKLESSYNRPSVENLSENRAFKTSAREIYEASNLEAILDDSLTKLLAEEENYCSRGSGFTLQSIDSLLLGVYNYTPMSGSSYIELPKSIADKRAIINPENNDQQCFKWAILAKHVTGENKFRVGKNYTDHEDRYSFEDISFPTSLRDILKFEKNNLNVSVNFFRSVVDNEKRNHFDLLLVTDYNNTHYTYISNFSRLIRSQKTSHEN
ncbi:hypothetical protein AGLY_016665 [Aphis glycines]|uniref:Uncharacterized protein n=1 Tax=Aphis glycines TaxID=307491 RepID=A0A6G0SYK0_APHGL|nr:hypothetical protein AGLY_016665 [Aphis glycines]